MSKVEAKTVIEIPAEKPAAKQRPAAKSQYVGLGKRINVGMLKLNGGDTVAFHFTGASRLQKIGKGDKDATLYRGTNMDTGEVCDLIAPQVLLSVIEREFKSDVTNKRLLLECTQRDGKNYLDVYVSELDATDPVQMPV